MDAKGYSVNIPWSCGGVGDNDYIFALQHVVLPIGHYPFFCIHDNWSGLNYAIVNS